MTGMLPMLPTSRTQSRSYLERILDCSERQRENSPVAALAFVKMGRRGRFSKKKRLSKLPTTVGSVDMLALAFSNNRHATSTPTLDA